jgi:tetratricopeptide (TPR) repeat protein
VDRGAIRALSDPEGALADYSEAIRLAGHPLAYNNRAFYYLERQNLEAALRDLEAGLPQAEDYPVLYATAAEVYAAAGRRELALRYLRLALQQYYEDASEASASPFLAPWLGDEAFRSLLAGGEA